MITIWVHENIHHNDLFYVGDTLEQIYRRHREEPECWGHYAANIVRIRGNTPAEIAYEIASLVAAYRDDMWGIVDYLKADPDERQNNCPISTGNVLFDPLQVVDQAAVDARLAR